MNNSTALKTISDRTCFVLSVNPVPAKLLSVISRVGMDVNTDLLGSRYSEDLRKSLQTALVPQPVPLYICLVILIEFIPDPHRRFR